MVVLWIIQVNRYKILRTVPGKQKMLDRCLLVLLII